MTIHSGLKLIVVSIMFFGCKHEKPFDAYSPDLDKRVAAYHAKSLDSVNGTKGDPALYIDFSAGINTAFKEPVISSLMTQCFNGILTDKFEVYKLGSDQVTPFTVSNTTQLGQIVSDQKQYKDIWAPIQKAVEQITSSNSDALLITDFEEWQNKVEVTNTAYLKIPFSKWLAKGNTIHFFIVDYKEGTIDKHIYFTVFNCGNPTAASLITKLSPRLASLSTRFDLSTSAYTLSTNYPGAKAGGVFYDAAGKTPEAKNVLDLKDSYASGEFYEFYPFGLDWKHIAEAHDSYKKENQFNYLFRNLFIDLSNEDSYTVKDIEVKVYDVSADFEDFIYANEVLLHKPKMVKGDDGASKISPDEKDPMIKECYNEDGSIKNGCKYELRPPVLIPELFQLNKDLLNNTRKSDNKKVELGISFDNKFNIKSIPNPDGLLKLDIVLTDAVADNNKLEKFKWVNSKGIPNIGLYESVKNTLEALKPHDKIIYSYYIKTTQN